MLKKKNEYTCLESAYNIERIERLYHYFIYLVIVSVRVILG